MTDSEQPLAGVPALVLGAGFGTRMLPFTEHIPKPLIPLLGRPLLGHPLIHLYAAGCLAVHVNAFHQSERLMAAMDAWVQRRLLRMGLHWSIEAPKILGTGGATRKLEEELCGGGGPFLMLNGDSVLGADLPALWQAHEQGRARDAKATLLCLPRPDAANYGAVWVDGDGRILDLAGLGRAPGVTDEDLQQATPSIFCGIQIIEPDVVDSLPPAGTESCIVRHGYAPLIESGVLIRAQLADPDLLFHDVGTPARYLDAQNDLMGGPNRRVFPTPPGVDPLEALFQEASYAVDSSGREYGNPDSIPGLARATIQPPVFFGPRNEVGPGAVIGPHASIGARNTLGANSRVEDSALWSGVELPSGEAIYGEVAAFLGGQLLRLRGREN
jgi:mannose-1-phosphate guanylyltransferase